LIQRPQNISTASHGRQAGSGSPQAPQARHRAPARIPGRAAHVTVVPNGYLWRETAYASLSTIARAITGTAWSGPRFFGLRSGQKVASHLSEWRDEYLAYERDEKGLVVKRLDDLLSASRIGCMSLRFAQTVDVRAADGNFNGPHRDTPRYASGIDFDVFRV
jgi:hypothetical protein